MNKRQTAIIIILTLLVAVVGFTSFEFIHGFSTEKQTKPTKDSSALPVPEGIPSVINVVLVGSDARPDDKSGRSDSLMIAQYNRETKQPKLVSIMRDSYVEIPGYDKDKINAAYFYGGIPLLEETLKQNFSVEPPYYISMTFDKFVDCINELFPKGVTLDAQESFELDGVEINKGKQQMDGNTLLQYARYRGDGEGDFGRIKRQQQVVEALSQQAKEVTTLLKLPKTIGKLMGSIETNLPNKVLLACGLDFIKGEQQSLKTLSIPVEGSWNYNDDTPSGSVLELELEQNQQAISAFLH
ncbi:LCP family protein [Enterococcus sp. AZ109]|uniref:LCP family protein n=1 Tax=Enterococcus sp. AZ109 TaxID=2774634 RepID=UPI003F22BE63